MFGKERSVVVGYDLSNEYAQISYLKSGASEPATLAVGGDEESFMIPLCLFKRKEVNQWFAGTDALEYSKIDEGELTDGLWERALKGDTVTVVGEEFDPLALLTLYVRRTLSALTGSDTGIKRDDIAGIMFTVPHLTKRAVDVLGAVAVSLEYSGTKVGFLGREESIFYYVTAGEKELWKHDVLIYDGSDTLIDCYRFFVNKITKPMVALVEKTSYDITDGADAVRDDEFLGIVHDTTDGHIVTCAYLIGKGFGGQWCRESLRELCRNRRTFKGNNLYSRGACYAMEDRLKGLKNEDRDMIFLGNDKLKANIGMNVIRCGEESYLALLDGGDNWFDAVKKVDLILDEGNSFTVTITPLDGRNIKKTEIVLDGLKEHEPKAQRIRLEVMMESEDMIRFNVTDLGFGEFDPGSGQLFTKTIRISDPDDENAV